MAIYRLLHNSPLGPEEIAVLTEAYELTLKALRLNERSDTITQLIAKKIMEVGQRGVRDPEQISITTAWGRVRAPQLASLLQTFDIYCYQNKHTDKWLITIFTNFNFLDLGLSTEPEPDHFDRDRHRFRFGLLLTAVYLTFLIMHAVGVFYDVEIIAWHRPTAAP